MRRYLKLFGLGLLSGLINTAIFPVLFEIYQIAVFFLNTGRFGRPLASMGIELWAISLGMGFRFFFLPSIIAGLILVGGIRLLLMLAPHPIRFGYAIGIILGIITGALESVWLFREEDAFQYPDNWLLIVIIMSWSIAFFTWFAIRFLKLRTQSNNSSYNLDV